jgi:hypothetical protein
MYKGATFENKKRKSSSGKVRAFGKVFQSGVVQGNSIAGPCNRLARSFASSSPILSSRN